MAQDDYASGYCDGEYDGLHAGEADGYSGVCLYYKIDCDPIASEKHAERVYCHGMMRRLVECPAIKRDYYLEGYRHGFRQGYLDGYKDGQDAFYQTCD